jgi:hypothetical protein
MERDQLENLGMDRGMILKWIFNKLLRDVDGIDLAQDTYKCCARGNEPLGS